MIRIPIIPMYHHQVLFVIENTQEINKVSKNDLNNLQKIANDYDETCYYDTLHSIDESLSTDDTSTTAFIVPH